MSASALSFQKPLDALIAADIQTRLRSIVTDSKGTVISTQVIKPSTDTLYPAIAVKVHVRGNIQSLRSSLYHLTNGSPLLIVDNLLVQRRHSSSRRNTKGADLLDIRFDVTGFVYRHEAKSP